MLYGTRMRSVLLPLLLLLGQAATTVALGTRLSRARLPRQLDGIAPKGMNSGQAATTMVTGPIVVADDGGPDGKITDSKRDLVSFDISLSSGTCLSQISPNLSLFNA